jgi:hypothetical protein
VCLTSPKSLMASPYLLKYSVVSVAKSREM